MRPILAIAAAAAFVSMAAAFVIKTWADAVFLAEYGAAFVPHFLVAQAVAVAGLSWGYGRLIKRGRTLAFDTVVLTALATGAIAAPLGSDGHGPRVFVITLGLVTGSALAQLAIWNAATSVVSGRAARAFLPKAGAAATAGAVVGGFGSSAIVGAFSISALAPVAGVLIAIALGLRMFLRAGLVIRKASSQLAVPARDDQEQRAVARLVGWLAAATVLEALLSAVIDFGFKREVAHAFAADEQRMGLFLSLFYGTSNVLLLVVQLIIASRLLATRSLKFSLGVQPVAQLLASAAWAVVPILPLAALSRGIENVFKFGLARPAQEVALTPLREVQRKRWKVLLRGVFAQGGALAAGLILIAAAPLWALHPALVPSFAAVLAAGWVVSQRRTAEIYRRALGSALGLRRRVEDAATDHALPVDRDSIERVVTLAADPEPGMARLGFELLDELPIESRHLISHIGLGEANLRQVIYRVLTARPDRTCLPALVRAVMSEPQGSLALGDGLLALASHDHADLLERARHLSENQPLSTTDPSASAGWFYRAAAGGLARGELESFFGHLIRNDGRRAAQLALILLRRGQMDLPAVEAAILAGADGTPAAEPTRQALFAAARVASPGLVDRLLTALDEGTPGAIAALGLLREDSVVVLGKVMAGRSPSPRAQMRFLRALRGIDDARASQLASGYLLSSSADVRDVAAHTILAQLRRGHPRPSARILAESLDAQLGRFELYVRARPGTKLQTRESAISLQIRNLSKGDVSAEAFFLDELDRQTERCLSQLCDLLALFGEPSTVYAAARALKSPSFKRRRQALDLLQETVTGRQRVRLLASIEKYLLPDIHQSPEARDAVCAIDEWLAKCRTKSGQDSRLLWALRSARIFDAAPGEAVWQLMPSCTLEKHPEGTTIVSEGEPGDALYVIVDGAVSVERSGTAIGQLGAGDSFGELALLDRQPRSATVRVIQDCQALRLPAEPFQAALAAHPELGLGLVRSLVQMLRAS